LFHPFIYNEESGGRSLDPSVYGNLKIMTAFRYIFLAVLSQFHRIMFIARPE